MLQAALKRFQLEYVDLVFCHRPDVYTPIEETVRAMNFVIEQGWAFYWGTSEWSAQQITEVRGLLFLHPYPFGSLSMLQICVGLIKLQTCVLTCSSTGNRFTDS